MGRHRRRSAGGGGDGGRPPAPRLLPQVRGREQQPVDAAAVHRHGNVVRPRGLDPAVGASAVGLPGRDGLALPHPHQRPARGLGHARRLLGGSLLLRAHGHRRQPLPAGARRRPPRRPRSQPPAAEPPPRGVPPAPALPGLRGLHHPLRLRGGRSRHRPARGRVAGRDPPLDPVRLGLPHHRHRAGGVVVLRGPGVGTGRGTRWRTPRSSPG